jgi:nucleotide-binding universal stress UspA family protein
MGFEQADEKRHLVLVVGYDGTEPAQRALEGAKDMLGDRPGRLEVVFVGHVPSTAALAPQALASVHEGLDHDAHDLAARAEETVADSGLKWHFQRRNGEIAPELLTAAQEQLDAQGPGTRVVLVLGGSAHKVDRYLNSTPAKVIRHHRFEVLVIP